MTSPERAKIEHALAVRFKRLNNWRHVISSPCPAIFVQRQFCWVTALIARLLLKAPCTSVQLIVRGGTEAVPLDLAAARPKIEGTTENNS
jgi:hypothetical protein